MTTNLDKHVRSLDDADLDAVSGGDVHDAAVRAALGYIYSDTLINFEQSAIYKALGPCWDK